jgi:MFS family permease
MMAGVFSGGVAVYVFYALQPHLLNLWGDPTAYGVAGLVAAIVAGAQIAGGLLTPKIRSLFQRRTSALLLLQAVGVGILALIGLVGNFWMVVLLVVIWALSGSAIRPIRQSYMNAMIPSKQRATILSFDSLMSSAGGIVAQPALGKSADIWGYQASFLLSAVGSAFALPFVIRARRLAAPADTEVAPTDVPSV